MGIMYGWHGCILAVGIRSGPGHSFLNFWRVSLVCHGGQFVGWTVRGGAWRALAAALLAPLARAFICGANGTDQGQQLTCVAHPGRFSSLSEAHCGTVARPVKGWRVGCWWDYSMVPMGSPVCHRRVHLCY